MVNQFHDHVFRDALAMTPCNERYTSAVKIDPGHANLAEELAPDYSNGFSSQSGQSPSASCIQNKAFVREHLLPSKKCVDEQFQV